MLDHRLLDLIDRVAPPAQPVAPFTLELNVPRDHPGLPRLMKAAAAMPNVELVRAGGLRVKKTQPELTRETTVELFEALRGVVGDTMADELEERLGVKKSIQAKDPRALVELARAAASLLPLGALARMGQ